MNLSCLDYKFCKNLFAQLLLDKMLLTDNVNCANMVVLHGGKMGFFV